MDQTATTTTETGGDDTSLDHLEAARAAFIPATDAGQKPPGNAESETKVATPPQEKPKGEDVVSKFIKLPGDKTKEAPADPLPADLTKDLDDLKGPADDAKSAPDWKKLKELAKSERIRAHQLQQQIAANQAKLDAAAKNAPADEATRARLEQLEAQNKTMSERLRVLDLKSHPDFEREFIAPQDQAKKEIASLLSAEGVEDVELEAMLKLKGKKFNESVSEVLEKLTPYGQQVFSSHLKAIATAQAGAEAAVAKAEDYLKTHQTARSAQSRVAFDAAGKEFEGAFLPLTVDEKAPDDVKAIAGKYNEALAGVKAEAEQLAFSALSESDAARVAHEAAHFRFLLRHGLPRIAEMTQRAIAEANERAANLETELKKITAAKPGVTTGGDSNAGDTPQDDDHLSAARKFWAARTSA